jgi:hypothetical protein
MRQTNLTTKSLHKMQQTDNNKFYGLYCSLGTRILVQQQINSSVHQRAITKGRCRARRITTTTTTTGERIPFPAAILSHNSCNNALHPLHIYNRIAVPTSKL